MKILKKRKNDVCIYKCLLYDNLTRKNLKNISHRVERCCTGGEFQYKDSLIYIDTKEVKDKDLS